MGEQPRTEGVSITLGGPQAHDSSVEKHFHERSAERVILSSNRIVISTGADPDFLPRCTGNDRVCGFQ
jgi:hypothetical protein